ncbi:MAG: M48 family metallopeptidase [Myxococcota bacterium]
MRFEAKLPDDSVNVSKGHPLQEAAILLVGVAGLVALITLLVAVSIDRIVPWLPPRLEMRLFASLGEAMAEEEAGSAAEPDPRSERVQALVERLAAHWSESPYPAFCARIVERSEPNAFALPGGTILVTTGLLDRIETENELAFVLAHELGHFAGRDHLRGLGRGVGLATAWGLLGLGRDQIEGLVGVVGTLSARRFDRGQESQADAFGLDLLVAEYGHAAGVDAVFDRVLAERAAESEPTDGEVEVPTDDGRDEAPRRAGDGVSAWWSTHPPSDARTRALAERMRAEGIARDGPQADWIGAEGS